MNTAITTIEGLRDWFLANKRPFFTLFLNGTGEKVILRNVEVDDLDKAWEVMQQHVLLQSGGGVANLRVYVTDKPNSNNGNTTFVRITTFSNPYAASMAGIAGIGSPANVLGINSKADLQEYLAGEKEKWELEKRVADLEAGQTADVDKWERILDKVAESPQLAGIAQLLIARLANVFLPNSGGVQMPVNGVQYQPANHATDDNQPSNGGDDDDEFYKELDDLTRATGKSELETLKKINQLRKANPEMFNQLLATA